MVTQAAIHRFLDRKKLALVGASRTRTAFGNVVLRELHAKGYEVAIIHPQARQIASFDTIPSISALPEDVKAVVIAVPPKPAVKLVQEAITKGIRDIWLLRGVESDDAVKLAAKHGVNLIAGECILMYVEPVNWLHGAHRLYRKLRGTLPR